MVRVDRGEVLLAVEPIRSRSDSRPTAKHSCCIPHSAQVLDPPRPHRLGSPRACNIYDPCMPRHESGTEGAGYTDRLSRLQGAGWKRWLDVQAPYRWNLRRLLGDRRVLDLGCGIGRNLAHLGPGSVGVDHNEHSIQVCRRQGLAAATPQAFDDSEFAKPDTFEGILAAHVLEHLPAGAAAPLLAGYLKYVRTGSPVVLICPQQRGFASDTTHTVYFDHATLRGVCFELGLPVQRELSFPLPTWAGRWFTYNEFVTVALTGAPA